MSKPLYRSKTFWTCLAGVLGAIGGYATGDLGLSQAVEIGLTSLIGLFLRDAVRSQS